MSETTNTAPAEAAQGPGPRTLQGVVTRDKNDKTRRVEVARRVQHPKYGKFIKRRTVCYTHDEKNESHLGDTVEIIESRPLSKLKALETRPRGDEGPEPHPGGTRRGRRRRHHRHGRQVTETDNDHDSDVFLHGRRGQHRRQGSDVHSGAGRLEAPRGLPGRHREGQHQEGAARRGSEARRRGEGRHRSHQGRHPPRRRQLRPVRQQCARHPGRGRQSTGHADLRGRAPRTARNSARFSASRPRSCNGGRERPCLFAKTTRWKS